MKKAYPMGRPLPLYGAPGRGACAARARQGWQGPGLLARRGPKHGFGRARRKACPGPLAEQDAKRSGEPRADSNPFRGSNLSGRYK